MDFQGQGTAITGETEVLALIDPTSRYVVVIPLKDRQASTWLQPFLDRIVFTFGAPRPRLVTTHEETPPSKFGGGFAIAVSVFYPTNTTHVGRISPRALPSHITPHHTRGSAQSQPSRSIMGQTPGTRWAHLWPTPPSSLKKRNASYPPSLQKLSPYPLKFLLPWPKTTISS